MVSPETGAQFWSIDMDTSPDTPAGLLIRAHRHAQGVSLALLAERVGCAKSYLSAIENGRRPPPSDAVLVRIEEALHIPRGRLRAAARVEGLPDEVRRELDALRERRREAARLRLLLAGTRVDADGRISGSLDRAYRSGELQRLVGRLADEPARDNTEPAALPAEVPLINRVAAGYPTEFTDLGYPARVADEYVRCPDIRDPDAFAARVVGDSMEPDYREGDIVIFSPAKDVRPGSDCFARLEPDQETTFKRVYFETGADGQELIRLQPVNNRYAPRVLPRERVAGLYAAASVLRQIP